VILILSHIVNVDLNFFLKVNHLRICTCIKVLVVWQNWGLGSQSRIKVFSLLIIYLGGPGRCFQVGVDLPPLSISRNPRWPLFMKNCNLIGIKSILCCKNQIFLMIQIDVHFWNEYVPCQWQRNQSKKPRDMLLSSKNGIASINITYGAKKLYKVLE